MAYGGGTSLARSDAASLDPTEPSDQENLSPAACPRALSKGQKVFRCRFGSRYNHHALAMVSDNSPPITVMINNNVRTVGQRKAWHQCRLKQRESSSGLPGQHTVFRRRPTRLLLSAKRSSTTNVQSGSSQIPVVIPPALTHRYVHQRLPPVANAGSTPASRPHSPLAALSVR
jgi:hypothetical protein